jgi:hypothetical protein
MRHSKKSASQEVSRGGVGLRSSPWMNLGHREADVILASHGISLPRLPLALLTIRVRKELPPLPLVPRSPPMFGYRRSFSPTSQSPCAITTQSEIDATTVGPMPNR